MLMDSSNIQFELVFRKICLSQALRFLGAPSWLVLSLANVPFECHNSFSTPPIEVFLSILQSGCHKLPISYNSNLVLSNLYGWKAFLTLEVPYPLLGLLGSHHHWATSLRYHSKVSLVLILLWALFKEGV